MMTMMTIGLPIRQELRHLRGRQHAGDVGVAAPGLVGRQGPARMWFFHGYSMVNNDDHN